MGKLLAFGFRGGMAREARELEAPGVDLAVTGFGGAWFTGGTISLTVGRRESNGAERAGIEVRLSSTSSASSFRRRLSRSAWELLLWAASALRAL
jgi:hypothetical protein